MNFIADWINFLRNDLTATGINHEHIPAELIPQYYLAVLDKLKWSRDNNIALDISTLSSLNDVSIMAAAGELALKCQQEIVANESYIKENEQLIHNSLLKQCPELTDEKYTIFLNWQTWDECELVWEFSESKIALKEKLKLRLN